MKWREKEEALGRVIHRENRLFSVFVVLIMVLVSFTTMIIFIPSTVKAGGEEPPYTTKTVWLVMDSGDKAAYLRERYPNTNYGNGNELCVDPQFVPLLREWRDRFVLYFDLSSLYLEDLPDSSYITNAELNLWYDSWAGNNPVGRYHACWELDCNWNEGTGGGSTTDASWNHDIGTSYWNSDPVSGYGGCYRDLNGDEVINFGGDGVDDVQLESINDWYDWDVTASVRRFVFDSGNYPNYGWLIDDKSEGTVAGYAAGYCSDDHDETEHTPRLKIVYRVPAVPTGQTNQPTGVEETFLTTWGQVTDDGDGTPCQYRFFYSYEGQHGPTSGYTSWTGSKTTGQTFSVGLTLVIAGTHGYYYAQVRHRTDTANVSTGSTVHFLTKPNTFTSGLGAIAISETRIDLSWGNGNGAVGAYVEYTTIDPSMQVWSPGNPFDDMYPVPPTGYCSGTGYIHTPVNPATTYWYKAWAYASDDGYTSNAIGGAFPYGDSPSAAQATTPGGSSPKPTYSSTNILLPDTNNFYPTYPNSIDVTIRDEDGWYDIRFVDVKIGPNLEIPAKNESYVIFRYDRDNPEFIVLEGTMPENWHLNTEGCVSGPGGFETDLRLLFAFEYITWEVPEPTDIDIVLYCEDNEENSKYNNFFNSFDIVNTVVPASIDSDDPTDRVNRGASVTVDFQVTFSEDPGAGEYRAGPTPVPGSEFNSISVYNAGDEAMGGDDTIDSSGQGSVSFDVPGEFGDNFYNLYLDMAHPAAPTGEYSYPTYERLNIITDEIVIGSLVNDSGDGRVNVGEEVTFSVSDVKLAYDNHPLDQGGSDTIQLTIGDAASWVTDHWEVTYDGLGGMGAATDIQISSASENTHGITAVQSGYTTHDVIWDQLVESISVDTINTGEQATINVGFTYDYDDTPATSYQYTLIRDIGGSTERTYTDYTNATINFKPDVAGWYNFSFTSAEGLDYGITHRASPIITELKVKHDVIVVRNANNKGVNYITWGAKDTITASKLAERLGLSGFVVDEPDDTIQIFDNTLGTWSTSVYVVGDGGTLVTINRGDHLRIKSHLDGTHSYSFSPDNSTTTDPITETMAFSTEGQGYGYITWTKAPISPSDFVTTLATNNDGLESNSNIELNVYNPTTGTWANFNAKWQAFATLTIINTYDVICFRAPGYTIDYDSTWFT